MSRSAFFLAGLLGAGFVLLSCSPEAQAPADLVLLHGKIVTLDEARPEARALAARDGRIVAVGSDAEIERLRGPETEVIDLAGMLAIPGWIEGHGHFTGIGASLLNVDLRDARTWAEVVDRVAAAAAERPPGEWILGRGWHQEKWEAIPEPNVDGYPTHDRLSQATPDHPVLLTHASGHASLINARAMALAGIDARTADPEGGKILRGPGGEPTGLLRERASNLAAAARQAAVDAMSPADRESRRRREIELAAAECLSKGITSFQDAGSGFDTVDRLRAMLQAGLVAPRLWVMLRVSNESLEQRVADYRTVGEMLTVRAVKRSLDGALGSHGAWLLAPYTDQPESVGHNTYPLDELERTTEIALEHDLQLCVHAIGDRANRETLDLFERKLKGRDDARFRIEHAQHLHPDDIPRFAALGVIASMQGVHCTSDGPWVPQRLGEQRCRDGAYVWRALIDAGATVSNGTDAPVEDVSPIASFHASVTRRMRNGKRFYPEQVMSRLEALKSYTWNAAYAAFEEEIKGSLVPGKLADITVLTRDILTVPEEEILETEVAYTIVGGRIVYRGEKGKGHE